MSDSVTGDLGCESFWLQSPAAAQRKLRLLEAIEESGSISRGAKALRVSYKTAWSLLETMNNLSSEPLVERTVGGRSGGGTQLTAPGRELLRSLRDGALRYRKLFNHPESPALEAGSSEASDASPATVALSQGLEGPNQYLATLRALEVHPEQIRAVVELSPGLSITACGARGTFTARMRGAGRPVLAHVNPSAILLVVGQDVRLSADNQLSGVVKRLRRGKVQCEVVLQLSLDRVLTVLVTSDSAERLELRAGQKVLACFSADAVTLLSP